MPNPQYGPISNPDKPAGGGNYGALDFDGNVLYGLNVGPGSPPQTHLVIINTANAAVTDIGRSVDGLAAIAFIPEPGTLALWMAGFAGLVSGMCGRLHRTRWAYVPNRCVALLLLAAICACLAAQPAVAITIDWVTVGDPGNPPNRNGQGDVPYVYRIGKYVVTVNQYVEFLNQKDPTGTNVLGLYDPGMSDATFGGISFIAVAADGHKYEAMAGRGTHPVNYVSFFDAARFANWLNNGQGDGDTEDGAYTLLGGTPIPSNSMEVTRNSAAQVFIPSQDEWIKAGHFLPGANIYFEYPTSTNTPPVSSAPTNVINRANFLPNGPGNLTDVGAYTGTTSHYGAYDMAGNVIQWTDTCEGCSPDPFPKRSVKGMAFAETDVALVSLSLFRAGNATGSHQTGGFRVASMIPEPSTGTLALVTCGLMWWLRRRLN
jgi:formylglycine-generating enzyme required for sulfatase activity